MEVSWQSEVKDLLQLEINVMRELLSNLHEEEFALMNSQLEEWEGIMMRRSDMVLNLQSLRTQRQKATAQALKKSSIAIDIPLEKLIAPEEEGSLELISLLDQLLALVERLNLQNCRNDQLFDQAKHIETLPLSCTYPHPNYQPTTARRRPATLTKRRKK